MNMCSEASNTFRDSIVASIPACHAGDRGSIPRHGDNILEHLYGKQKIKISNPPMWTPKGYVSRNCYITDMDGAPQQGSSRMAQFV